MMLGMLVEVLYCLSFTKAGYSKFGSYTANSNGTFVFGFSQLGVLIKQLQPLKIGIIITKEIR